MMRLQASLPTGATDPLIEDVRTCFFVITYIRNFFHMLSYWFSHPPNLPKRFGFYSRLETHCIYVILWLKLLPTVPRHTQKFWQCNTANKRKYFCLARLDILNIIILPNIISSLFKSFFTKSHRLLLG
jgi:uncharacterized membrane protein